MKNNSQNIYNSSTPRKSEGEATYKYIEEKTNNYSEAQDDSFLNENQNQQNTYANQAKYSEKENEALRNFAAVLSEIAYEIISQHSKKAA